ncbi:MAG: hypothetical protein VKL42_10195 [Snowella sp.]|nr:hypothetical protein [Snowella sp.]
MGFLLIPTFPYFYLRQDKAIAESNHKRRSPYTKYSTNLSLKLYGYFC